VCNDKIAWSIWYPHTGYELACQNSQPQLAFSCLIEISNTFNLHILLDIACPNCYFSFKFGDSFFFHHGSYAFAHEKHASYYCFIMTYIFFCISCSTLSSCRENRNVLLGTLWCNTPWVGRHFSFASETRICLGHSLNKLLDRSCHCRGFR
jgi:hypothetical protein